MNSSGTGTMHRAARQGFTIAAGHYVRSRPSYEGVLDVIESLVGRGPGWIGDVGAGTGALSVPLAARGHPVLAVEPLAEMLARCGAGPLRVRGMANALPVRTGALRAITVGTAFHWFSTPEVLDEFHRCLRASGILLLLWSDRDLRVPWVRQYTEMLEVYAGDAPRFRSMGWREAIDAHDGWREVAYVSLPNPTPSGRDHLLERILSTSFVGALGAEEAAGVRAEVEAFISDLPEEFDYPYITRLWAYRPV